MQQQVMFTACPNGRTAGGLRLSVRISPQLDPEAAPNELATFPDFLDWPAQNIRWRVSVGGGDPITATVESDPPSSQLWTGLFSPDTLVRKPVFPDYTHHLWWSYPVGNLVDYIHGLYQQIATAHPTEHPPVSELINAGLLDLSHRYPDDGRDKRRELRRILLEQKVKPNGAAPPEPPNPELDSFQLWNFHQPGTLDEEPKIPDFDFHEVVALCGEHFGLLRRLGLVVDLIVRGSFPDGPTTVSIVPEWSPSPEVSNSNVLPVTRCTIGPGQFLPRPKDPGEIVDGRLPLNDASRYRIVQVDPDGGTLNLIMLARNLVQSSLTLAGSQPDPEVLPALRSAGISVARTGHAPQLVERVAAGFQLHTVQESGDTMFLDAEDLWHGTRFDVLSAITNQWYSLQRRRGDYHFIELDHHEEIAEEAAVIEVPSSRDEESDDPEDDKFLYLQESLARWDGYSLATPRPGRTLDDEDQVIDPPEETAPGYPLLIKTKAEPGSLPRLRFGTRYRVRARAVDIAGNSVPFDDDPSGAADITYLRYEPVPPPFVLMAASRTEGESDAHVVLRSNYNEAPFPSTVERHITPPRTAQRSAEEHGKYDTDNGKLDAGAYQQIIAREAQSFADPEYGGGIGQPDPDNYNQPFFPVVPLPVLYLPDPMARGAAFFLPDSGEEVSIPFEGGHPWPEARPVRLVLVEGSGPPELEVSDEEAVIRFKLPQAETVKVRLSSYVDLADLPLSAIWRLMTTSGAPSGQIEQWRNLAARGRLWMITPYRTLELVHAVRQPLKPPVFQDEALHLVPRQPGDTFANLSGEIDFSRKSTGRVDLHAAWSEPVDLGPGGGVEAEDPLLGDEMRKHEEWLEIPLEQFTGEGLEDLLPITNRRHEFHDTKRRVITYTAKATSKFTEYFQERVKNVQVAPSQVVVLPLAPIVEESELVRESGDGPSFDRDLDYDLDYETGELTWKSSHAEVDIAYLPEPISRTSDEAENEAERDVTLDIRSTARPLAPKVLYAIPTHRWHPFALGSTGEGGGLRVYLDRPFFETGVGQLLGVVLDPNHNAPSEALAPYTTRWGFDPLEGPPPPLAPLTKVPRPQDFPLAAENGIGANRALAENGLLVNVVGHAVGFDKDRKLYFCDIEVESGEAYQPFIRLALASYQPSSVADLHLSPVVLADIVQLTPDRTATIQFKSFVGGHPDVVEVRVIGVGPAPETPRATPTEMTAHLERRIEDVADDLLGWEEVPDEEARVVLKAERDPDGMTSWIGELRLPPVRHSSHEELRVAIQEWQLLPVSTEPDNFVTYLPLVETQGGQGSATSSTYLPYAATQEGRRPSTSAGRDDEGGQRDDDDPRVQVGRRLLYRDFIPLQPAVKAFMVERE